MSERRCKHPNRCGSDGYSCSREDCAWSPELFTLQIQGKGLRFKKRIPGWLVASVIESATKASPPVQEQA